MPNLKTKAIARTAEKIPGIKEIPVVILIEVAEIVLLAYDHVRRLEPEERRRVFQLLRKARGRPSNLSQRERTEFARLAAKAQPRLFLGLVAEKLSPVPLPKRLVHGTARS
jgi:hypothetical protein